MKFRNRCVCGVWFHALRFRCPCGRKNPAWSAGWNQVIMGHDSEILVTLCVVLVLAAVAI